MAATVATGMSSATPATMLSPSKAEERESYQHHQQGSSSGATGGQAAATDEEEDGDDEEGDDGEDDEDEHMRAEYNDDELAQENTIKSGYLWKKGEKRKTWKKRWFVLRSFKLAYYKNEKEYQLLRLIDMSEVHTVASVEMKRNENSFGIVTPRRTYYVKASSKQDMQGWIERLNEVRTQLAQASTLTQDLAKTSLTPLITGAGQGAAPGTGILTSPSQPRPIPTGAVKGSTSPLAFSPVTTTTATSDSESSEAQRQGLGYASSFGQSMQGSSPSRAHANDKLSSGGYSPANSHSGGEASDLQGKGRSPSASRRDRSHGSSGNEHLALPSQGQHTYGSSASSAGGVVSSSEDEEWDEDEGADQAMPLPALTPGGVNFAPMHPEFAEQMTRHGSASTATSATTAEGTTDKAAQATPDSDILRDANRVLLQGYLMKQSNRRKHWRKRWFVLTTSKLMYTRSHMDAKAHRQIPIASILDAIEYESKKAHKEASHSSSPPISPSGTKGYAFGSFGDAADASVGGEGEGDDGLGGGSGPQSHPVERRSSMMAAASGVASSVGAGVGVGGAKKKKENCFRIITPKRNFLICAPSEDEEIKWLSTLQTLITRVRGAQEQREQQEQQRKQQQQLKTVHGFQPQSASASSSNTVSAAATPKRTPSTAGSTGGGAAPAASGAAVAAADTEPAK